MLEAGLSLIGANLVVFYGLIMSLARGRRRAYRHPSTHHHTDPEPVARRSSGGILLNSDSTELASFATCSGPEPLAEDIPVGLRDIRVTQTLAQTEDSL